MRPTDKNLLNSDSATQRRRRLNQIAHEEAEAERMRAEGYEVFSPTVVCDRVAIKNGKVYFVEFKKPGQSLREGQHRVKELVPHRYLVRYSETTKPVVGTRLVRRPSAVTV
jgi:hypothetical protein